MAADNSPMGLLRKEAQALSQRLGRTSASLYNLRMQILALHEKLAGQFADCEQQLTGARGEGHGLSTEPSTTEHAGKVERVEEKKAVLGDIIESLKNILEQRELSTSGDESKKEEPRPTQGVAKLDEVAKSAVEKEGTQAAPAPVSPHETVPLLARSGQQADTSDAKPDDKEAPAPEPAKQKVCVWLCECNTHILRSLG